jgi:hypothetical protein
MADVNTIGPAADAAASVVPAARAPDLFGQIWAPASIAMRHRRSGPIVGP